MGVIYKATCLVTGKSYIGQTNNFQRRKKEHLKAKGDTEFHKAIRKYGENNFVWRVIDQCPDYLLNKREKYWIKVYDTHDHGYNMTNGGGGSNTIKSCVKRALKPNRTKKGRKK